MSGFIYFIETEGGEYVKIGWSLNHPEGRRRTLQTGCPKPLDLVAFFPGSLEDERRLHRTFAELAYRGEWFFHIHKLRDFTWYLTSDGERGPEVPRQIFEDAIWDVLVSGYEWPHRSDLEEYTASANPEPWRFLFPGETLQ